VRQLSENARKTILWSVVIILGITLFFWWGRNIRETLENISLPKIPKEFQESVQRTREELTFPAFEEIEVLEEVLQEL